MNEVCVGIFALKDLKENEELTFDYQFDFFKAAMNKKLWTYLSASQILSTVMSVENQNTWLNKYFPCYR